jgi:plasmid stability protein
VKEQPKTVGFQLDNGHHRRLEERAQRYQMSPGQYAREIIIRALDSNEEGIFEALNWLAEKANGAATAEDLSKFRGDVSHNMKEIVKALESLNQAVKKRG